MTLALVAALVFAVTPPPESNALVPPLTPPFALEQNLPAESRGDGAGAVLWVLAESALKKDLVPLHCRWCETDALDAWARGIRSPLKDQGIPDLASTLTDYAVIPLVAAGLEWSFLARAHTAAPLGDDVLDVAESVVISSVLNETVKGLAGRERPFVHVLTPVQKTMTANPWDNNASFYSGHTQLAFSLVASLATVAELRGYENSWLVWAVGMPLATGVGLLRMAADKHYLTDVAVGAAMGTLVGVGVPRLFHPRKLPGNVKVQLSAGAGTVALLGWF